MAIDLITKAEYKAYVGITNPNEDAVISALIPKVSALVKNYCRRSFVDHVDEALVETSDGGDTQVTLKSYPVINLSLTTSVDFGLTNTALVEYTDYVVDKSKGLIYSTSTAGFPYKLRGYTATYTNGYECVPDDLKLAVMDLVTYYRKNDSAVHSNKSPGTNSVQIEYISTTSLPAHIKRVLDLYVADYL